MSFTGGAVNAISRHARASGSLVACKKSFAPRMASLSTAVTNAQRIRGPLAQHRDAPFRPLLAASSQRPSLRSMYASSMALGNTTRALSLWPFGSSGNKPSDALVSDVSGQQTNNVASTATGQTADVPQFPTSDDVAAVASEAQDSIAHATDHVNTLASLGELSGWPNVRACQAALDWVVEATGMPWWLTIAAITLSVRILVLPLVLYGQKNAIRLANIQPRMQVHMNDIQYAKSTGDQVLLAKSVQSVQQLMKDNDCHPMRSLVTPIVQAPLFMTFFFALRGLGEAGLSSMQTGGLAWFTDLTAPDPYLLLPVLSSAVMLLTIETGAEMGTAGGQAQNTPQARTMRWFLRGMSVLVIPFVYHFPTAVFCYWTTNGIISLVQLFLLNTSFVRQSLNLPQRIQHSEDEKMIKTRKGEQKMSFWDAVGTGMTSQQPPSQVRVIRRNQAPSVLQSQQDMEESRERALKRLQESGERNSQKASNKRK